MFATSLSEVRAVFFDAVGTLIFPNPSAITIYSEVARLHGLALSNSEIQTRFRSAYQAEEDADRQAGWLTSESRETARWRRIVIEALDGVPDPESCFRDLFDHFARPRAWRVNREAPEVLRWLHKRGLILGLGSNYDSRLLSVLSGMSELDEVRDRVVISAAVGFRKPSERFFHEVARAADCDRNEVMFVGDDITNDYRGAAAAGLHAVLLDKQDQAPTVADRVRSLADLIAHFADLP